MAIPTGRRVKDSSEEIKESLHRAKMALYAVIGKTDPIDKNEGIAEALRALELASVTTEEIREICISSAKRGSYGSGD